MKLSLLLKNYLVWTLGFWVLVVAIGTLLLVNIFGIILSVAFWDFSVLEAGFSISLILSRATGCLGFLFGSATYCNPDVWDTHEDYWEELKCFFKECFIKEGTNNDE